MTMNYMRAVAVLSPGVVKIIDDLPIPEPGDYEALAKIHACGFCSGTDSLIIRGENEGIGPYGAFPTILGHEAAGEVVRVGKKVRNIKVGDRAINPMLPAGISDKYSLTYGCMSEYGLVSDRKAMLEDGRADLPYYEKQFIFSSDLDYVDAGVLLSLSECHSAITNFGVSAGDEIVVYGSGPMGIAMSVFARMAGAARIVQIDCIAERLDRAKRLASVDRTINFAQENADTVLGDRTFDLIVDAVGSPGIILEASRRLKPGGKIGALGVLSHKNSKIDVADLRNNTCLHMLNYPHGEYDAMPKVVELIRKGKINPKDYYTHAIPFTQVQEAITHIEKKTALKVVLTF